MKMGEKYTLGLYEAITDCFNDESENFIGNLENVDATELFTSSLRAITLLFNELTSDNKNLIEMTHLLNSLAVQHVVKASKEDSE